MSGTENNWGVHAGKLQSSVLANWARTKKNKQTPNKTTSKQQNRKLRVKPQNNETTQQEIIVQQNKMYPCYLILIQYNMHMRLYIRTDAVIIEIKGVVLFLQFQVFNFINQMSNCFIYSLSLPLCLSVHCLELCFYPLALGSLLLKLCFHPL